MKRGYQIAAAVMMLFLAGAAQAHTFGAHGAGFAAGMAHPFTGLDHVLAMIAVGLWAAQLGGRAVWAVPATFVATMALGAALSLGGMPLPAVEAGIAGSVLILGLLIFCAARLPLTASMALVGAFALFHGYTHGSEMPQAAFAWLYVFGFILSTVMLHILGIRLGNNIQQRQQHAWLRLGGLSLTTAGAVMLTYI